MTNKHRLLASLGLIAFLGGAFPAWNQNRDQDEQDPLGPQKARIADQHLKLTQATDGPAEALAHYVNRRTGGWVPREGERGVDPKAMAIPLDANDYVAAAAHIRKMNRFSSTTGAILPSEAASPKFNVRAAAVAGETLGTWTSLGPTNFGGRTRELIIHPTSPNIMYAAAVGGGVWKTTDGGANWTPITDLAISNIAVTSLAFDPRDPNKVYAGTGEGYFNNDAIRGAGIFVTSNAGSSWSQVASTGNSDFHFVNDIVVSPRNPNRIYATTRTGVWKSINSGTSWTRIATGPNGCGDLAIQLRRSIGFVYAACGFFTSVGDVKRILDNDVATSMTSVFSTSNMSRTVLAIAPSDENIIYAMASTNASGSYRDGVLGVYRSVSQGASGTWTTQMANNNSFVDPVPLNNLLLTYPIYAYSACVGTSLRSFINQGWYAAVLKVDPMDPNRVWAGGYDLFRSDDGGVNFGIASYGWKGQGDPTFVNASNHAIAFHPNYDGATNKIMFVTNDGGIFRTNDARANVGTTVANVCGTSTPGAVTWTELNNGYITTQFHHGSTSPNGSFYLGGTQANGTLLGSQGNLNWTKIVGGGPNGGYTAIDEKPSSANNVLLTAATGLSIQKSTNNGLTFSDATVGISGDTGFAYIAPFHMNPANKQHVWTGGYIIWRTTNQATSWQRASLSTPGSGSVSAITSSNLDTNKVVFGMEDGWIGFSTAALSANLTTNWNSTRPRTTTVTSLAFDPSNSNIVWATYGTFTGVSVYKSTNSGASWTAVPGSGVNTLPPIPALSVVVDPADSNRVYVGTDMGVFTTIDGGANWYQEVSGFANVPVEWLDINASGTRRLRAFTYGRGAWSTNIVP